METYAERQKKCRENWRLKNLEKYASYSRKYYHANKEKIMERRKKPVSKEIEEKREYNRLAQARWREKNKFKINQKLKQKQVVLNNKIDKIRSRYTDNPIIEPIKRHPRFPLFKVLDVLQKHKNHFLNRTPVIKWSEKEWETFNKLKSA